LESRSKLLHRRQSGISIHPRLAGLDRQGFPGVSTTFEAYKISRQGLDVGGLFKLKITHRLLPNLWSARMNKSDLVDAIADSAGLSKADAGRAVDALVNTVTGALQSGQAVSLVGFGTFSVRDRAARMGRNPRTGETIHIAASKNPAFKAGKALKDAVN
jgi:DNA-binding protein HU-beta